MLLGNTNANFQTTLQKATLHLVGSQILGGAWEQRSDIAQERCGQWAIAPFSALLSSLSAQQKSRHVLPSLLLLAGWSRMSSSDRGTPLLTFWPRLLLYLIHLCQCAPLISIGVFVSWGSLWDIHTQRPLFAQYLCYLAYTSGGPSHFSPYGLSSSLIIPLTLLLWMALTFPNCGWSELQGTAPFHHWK